ncbi:MAG TPA: division/cell wall cluster transcriptional repressor MraZ [Anaerolineales bacterium]|nr:division/cell wall cluster transcriptional repressor MraZ [Anaerolineales bacterium]
MFLGRFAHTIDAKGRLTIPVRFRAAISGGAYVTQGFDRNLLVYTSETFQRVVERAARLTATNPEVRAVFRVIFGSAHEVELDTAGRILIQSFLREYAQLDAESTIVGAGQYFEIWNTEIWKQEAASVTDPEKNARRFADFDLSSG